MNSRRPTDHAVEDTAGPDLVPGVVTHAFPAADNIQPFARLDIPQHRQKSGDLSRVILQVGVEGENDFAAGGPESRRQGRRLAEIAAKANAVYFRVLPRQLGDDRPRAVRAAVVHQQDFQIELGRPRHPGNLRVQRRQAVALVEHRNDDRDHDVPPPSPLTLCSRLTQEVAGDQCRRTSSKLVAVSRAVRMPSSFSSS